MSGGFGSVTLLIRSGPLDASGPARVTLRDVREIVRLGEITCPSGELILMDGGYLGLWSGERSPDEVQQPDEIPAVDLEIVCWPASAACASSNPATRRA